MHTYKRVPLLTSSVTHMGASWNQTHAAGSFSTEPRLILVSYYHIMNKILKHFWTKSSHVATMIMSKCNVRIVFFLMGRVRGSMSH